MTFMPTEVLRAELLIHLLAIFIKLYAVICSTPLTCNEAKNAVLLIMLISYHNSFHRELLYKIFPSKYMSMRFTFCSLELRHGVM